MGFANESHNNEHGCFGIFAEINNLPMHQLVVTTYDKLHVHIPSTSNIDTSYFGSYGAGSILRPGGIPGTSAETSAG